MKTLFNFCGVVLLSYTALAQTQPTVGVQGTSVPSPTPYEIASQDADSRVWESTTYETSPSGQVVPKLHYYTELATGLSYQHNGQWVDSQEQINIQSDGTASATQGQHQAYFPSDIGNGMIKLVTPDGQQLQSQPLGLFYDDGTNSVMIAELTNAIGQLISSNQVIYTNAFTGVDADLLYVYRKSGFEQDVIFREQPPTPEQFGLNSDNTRLQLLTEYANSPTPGESVGPVDQQDELQDTTLTFGAMKVIQGRAFLTGDATPQNNIHRMPVYKSWTVVNGRTFLVEELPYQRINPQLEALPASTLGAVSSAGSVLRKVSATRLLPPIRLVAATTNTTRIAEASVNKKPGFVFDYVTVSSAATNFTFQGDTTYLVSDDFYLTGTNVVEGGAVIKTSGDGMVEIDASSSLTCNTASYCPAIFTSYNDNSVGEIISGSSGYPNWLDGNISIQFDTYGDVTVSNLRFCYASQAINLTESSGLLTARDCQFLNVLTPIAAYNIGLYNDLIGDTKDEVGGVNGITNQGEAQVFVEGPQLIAENVTADSGYAFIVGQYPSNYSIALTNCIITLETRLLAQGGSATLSTKDVVYSLSPSIRAYQEVGAGNYYLTNTSPYRHYGTTNIDSNLLADLAQKTTYPPVVFSNTTIPYATNFMPQAQRDNSGVNVDVGYHYDPIDYMFGSVQAATNITFSAGTVMGYFSKPTYGIALPNSAIVTFNGTATSPCIEAHYTTVQEGDNNIWLDTISVAGIVADGTSGSDLGIAPIVNAQFTHFAGLNSGPDYVRDYTSDSIFNAKNCEFSSGNQGGYGIHDGFTNCLFNGLPIIVQGGTSGDSALVMENCTMREGYILTSHWSSSTWPVWIQNSAYEGTDLSQMDDPYGSSSYIYCDYNSFLTSTNQLANEGTHTVVVTNGYYWETSWFGNFYLPTNSPLITAGSTNANYLGLYHFTTQTNQTPEGTNIVDIGYHYVATDNNGNPLDSNGDGIPDYLEDPAGNGSGDWDNTLFLNVIITQPRNGSTIP